MDRAAEGNAAGEIKGALERRPVYAGDDEAHLRAELAALRDLLPGAHAWYVRQHDGHVTWQLQLNADSPDHLLEGLRYAAQDAERGS